MTPDQLLDERTVETLIDPTAPRAHAPAEAPGMDPSSTGTIALVDGMLHKASDWGRGILDACEQQLRIVVPGAAYERVDLDPIRPVPPELWANDVGRRSTAVVIAAGDCITCTARSVQSAIATERLGIPAVIITTPAVVSMVDAVCATFGAQAVRVLLIETSLFGRSRKEIGQIAATYIEGLRAALLRGDDRDLS
jgi:hypothetical protein